MDAVSQVLVARSRSADGLNSMVGISVMAHLVVLAAVVLVPADWWGAKSKEPEIVLQVSLGGPEGPRDGGLATLGGRPIQQAVETKAPIEPVRPPAARQPEMVEPTKRPPIKTTPNKVEAKDPKSRTPTKGAELQQGTTVADTKGRGFETGLSAGAGGAGGYLDVANFCCPEYLATMKDFITRNWNSKQQAVGITYMHFVIQKDGRIADVEVEKSSGNQALDYLATRALTLTKLPPLPPAYDQPVLGVHMQFEYQK